MCQYTHVQNHANKVGLRMFATDTSCQTLTAVFMSFI